MKRATLNEFFQPLLKPEIVFFAAAIQRAGEKRPQGNGAVNWGRTGVTGFGWSPTLANTFNLDTLVQIFVNHIHFSLKYIVSIPRRNKGCVGKYTP